jgi:excisionase family DNA binding protein
MDLSLQQAADILGKTRRQVIYMIGQGRLPGKKVGGRWVIDRVDLQADEAVRQRTLQKQERLKAVVEDVLTPTPERRYGIRDLKAVQLATSRCRQLSLVRPDPVNMSQVACHADVFHKSCCDKRFRSRIAVGGSQG